MATECPGCASAAIRPCPSLFPNNVLHRAGRMVWAHEPRVRKSEPPAAIYAVLDDLRGYRESTGRCNRSLRTDRALVNRRARGLGF